MLLEGSGGVVLGILLALATGAVLIALRRENSRAGRDGVPWWQKEKLPGRGAVLVVWSLLVIGVLLVAVLLASRADDAWTVAAIALPAVLVVAILGMVAGRRS